MAAFLELIKTIKSEVHARMNIVGETLVQWLRWRLRWREFTLGDLMCGNGNHQQVQPIWKWRRWLLRGSHRVDSEILSFKSLKQLSERAKVWSNNSPLGGASKTSSLFSSRVRGIEMCTAQKVEAYDLDPNYGVRIFQSVGSLMAIDAPSQQFVHSTWC
jgi:hypothetical protein